MATDDLDDARVLASLSRILNDGAPYVALPGVDPATFLPPAPMVEAFRTELVDTGRLSEANLSGTIVSITGQLPQFAKAISEARDGVRRVKVVNYGDSMGQTVWREVAAEVEAAVGGVAGAYGPADSGINSMPGAIARNAVSGTITNNTADFDNWPTGVSEVFAAGAVREYVAGPFTGDGWSTAGGGTLYSDQWRVFYAKSPSGGTFKLQIDGVDIGATVDTSGTLGTVGVITVNPTLGDHKLRIVNLSGTVTILLVGYENTTVSGLVSIGVTLGGSVLANATSRAWGHLGAVLATLAPDLMTIEAKETAAGWPGALTALFAMRAASVPLMDVIGIGSPPVSDSGAGQDEQNNALRAACLANGATYVDTNWLFPSYADMAARGFITDGTHPETNANRYRGSYLARVTGLTELLGRLSAARRQFVEGFTFRRRGTPSSVNAGHLYADPDFGFDLMAKLNRWFRFYDVTGTEIARLSNDRYTFLPYAHLETLTGPLIRRETDQIAKVIRGDLGATLTTLGDFAARTFITVVTSANISGAVSANLTNGSVQLLTLTGNVTSFTFQNAVGMSGSAAECEVHFIQDGTGSRTLAGAHASIKWAGAAPTLTTTAGRRDIFRFRISGGSFYEISRSMNVG